VKDKIIFKGSKHERMFLKERNQTNKQKKRYKIKKNRPMDFLFFFCDLKNEDKENKHTMIKP